MTAHRVTTKDYKESKETGKLYLGTEFYRQLSNIIVPTIITCEYCGISRAVNKSLKNKKYCSHWCKCQDRLRKITLEKMKKQNEI